MKTTLIMAPAYMTIQADVRRLPRGNEELEIIDTKEMCGGFGLLCAEVRQLFCFPYIVASLSGSGMYGEKLREYAETRGIAFPYLSEEEAGSVLVFREPGGRTMTMRVPGCEYDISYYDLAEEDSRDFDKIIISSDMLAGETPEDVLDYLYRAERPVEFVVTDETGSLDPELLEDLFARKPAVILEDIRLAELTGIRDDLKKAAEILQEKTQADCIIVRSGTGVFLLHEGELTLAEETGPVDVQLFAALFSAVRSSGLTTKNSILYALSCAADRYTRKHLSEGQWEYEKQKLKEMIVENR